MPQATLLDFFESRTPGPFAHVALAPQSTQSTASHTTTREEAEISREGASAQELSSAQSGKSTHRKPTGLFARESPDAANEEAVDTNVLRREPHLPGLTIDAIEIDHLPALKRLTGNILPVRYPDKFFDGAINETIPATFSRVALIDEKPVGWIRCRLDPFPEQTEPPSMVTPIYNRLYVQALCLLAPYRGLGIATALLNVVTQPHLIRDHAIAHVYAHVWEKNEEALEWYGRRGFSRVMKVEQYYRRLRPDGAWIVQKDLQDP